MKNLIIENLTKIYDSKIVLDDISLKIPSGAFVSILGPSGCGKTTLLRCIIGIEDFEKGKILIDEKNITHEQINKRNMGIVFQNYSLFPNLTVYKNIEIVLKSNLKFPKNQKEQAKSTYKKIIDNVLSIVELSEHSNKKPNQLSGGQQQRVAIARILALNPEIILFDEPFAALDNEIRNSLRVTLKKIQKEKGITMIFITHDQEEAFSLSDKICILNDGKVSQYGTPKEIYKNPANDFVLNFCVKSLDDKYKSIKGIVE